MTGVRGVVPAPVRLLLGFFVEAVLQEAQLMHRFGRRGLLVLASMLLGGLVTAGPAGAATCLQASPIDRKHCQLGGDLSVLGAPVGGIYPVGAGQGRTYQRGVILWSAATGAYEVHGAILARYRAAGGATGFLGFPTTDERVTPDRIGRYNHFSKAGSIYWTPSTGAHDVRGSIRTRWASMGWERSVLGYPVSNEYAVNGGRESDFQRGFLHWDAAGGWIRLALGRVLAPGVAHRAYTDARGPFALNVVTLDPAGRGTIDTVLSQGQLAGLDRPSSMAQQHGALVAVNGDFYLASGRPVHLHAEDGELMQAPMLLENQVSSTGVGVDAGIGRPVVGMRLGVARTGATAPVTRVNNGPPAAGELALFTPRGSGLETPPGANCSARLRPSGSPVASADGRTRQSLSVESVACGSPSAQDGAWVLSARQGGAYEQFVRALQPGDPVSFDWTVGRPRAFDVLGGNPVIVQDGQVHAPSVEGTGPYYARNPRTGIGVAADGVVYLVTVDGRQTGSVGMTLPEFADYLRQLGAGTALNLDGGGSTTMAVNGVTVNRPSDGAERLVANALVVLNGPDLASTALQRSMSAPPTATEQNEAWQREAHDPGSTGGWADARQQRRLPLPSALRRVAAEFRTRP
jgi:hypothetical protein